MFVKCITSFTVGTLALMAMLTAVTPIHGQEQGWSFSHPSGWPGYPWSSPGYQGYSEPKYDNQAIAPSAPMGKPQQYEAYVSTLPEKNTQDPKTFTLVAHVPANAQIWVEDMPTTSKGPLRTFQSPELAPGNYYSTVRVAWIENDKVVSQTKSYAVKAGDVQCVYLVKTGSELKGEKAAVEANLSKLSVEDRKLAAAQQFCAVQKGVLLGAMGTPVKIMLNGQPAFLCCEACRGQAVSDPDRTLAKVRELKAKTKAPTLIK